MNTAHIALPKEKIAFWVDKMGDKDILFQPIDRKVHTYSWKDISDQAYRMVGFLKAQGYQPGDTVAILAKNCAHWIIADFALMLGGFVSVPIYPTANQETISYILEHSECKAVFIGKLDDQDAAEKAVPEHILKISMPYPTIPCDHQWQDIIDNTEPDYEVPNVSADDLMTILYTSGSTGHPKGAMHSYKSFVLAGKNTGASIQVTTEDRILSYLPMSHCTERNYVCSILINWGFEVYFVESLATFADDLAYARPTLFGSVPRLWTQFQKKILHKIPNNKLQFMLKIPILSGIVKRKIRKQMGLDKAYAFISGSAPISRKLLEWYRGIGIDIAEGWGMTETFACGSMPKKNKEVRFGTISQPSFEVDIKIAEDDEILVRCTSNMIGYYKEEDKTKEVLNEHGYIHTGDLGKLEDGYLSITGRKKDIFKTEKGKYVAPIPIESDFGENEFIELMCLVGTQLVQPVLIVNLSEHAEGYSQDDLKASLENSLKKINEKLESHEKVGGIIVLEKPWTTESGELTPTLKVKRHVVESRYLDIARQLPQGHIIWH
ncbi:AMP-binding protein [Alteromonas sp. a30]|uniref:AMP-binding protein n=1 Tax=Alteromonas sp. a30 TaxID=2730917 RepID=UPI0022814045|nr:AMP-binding protein [Alteromonas sp. a30]MCY7293828.1 AMP-binding protein [Alteromonas sp. a30]